MRTIPTGTLAVAHCLLLLVVSAGAESRTERLLRVERPAIDKIVALAAQEHATVLFTIDHVVGYAKDGKLEWISKTPGSSPCPNPDPQLSHRGDKVLYQLATADHKCQLMIYDTVSLSSRQLLVNNNREFFGTSWSWDDSQVTVLDSRGLIIVTIDSGDQRVALPSSEFSDDGYQYDGSGVEWLHDGNTLLIALHKFIPNAKQTNPPWIRGRTIPYVAAVRNGRTLVLGVGRWPSVSPANDEIAAIADNKLVVMTVDGHQPRIVSDAPRYPRYLPLFRGDLGPVVWSPDAGRLFFLNVVSDNATDNIYMLDLKSGRRKLFLEKTTITISGWR